jgi:hypothetical protein
MRRLTQEQYRNSLHDIFGNSVAIGGQFEPDPRSNFLLAVGSGHATVTASALEQYARTAKTVAAQVVDKQHRGQLIPCKPPVADKADDRCAREFLGKVGHLLFRRPLTTLELDGYAKLATQSATQLKDFYAGLQLALAGMLEAPQFLFIRESVESDPSRSGALRLAPSAMATRISFLLWNTTPDLPLLNAAERGDLRSAKDLQRQVDRLLVSPRLAVGVRAFFADMLGFDAFDSLAKDTQLYPAYTRDVATQAEEQTLRTIVDQLLDRNGDYRDLFTTRDTFMTPLLASVYRVPLPVASASGLANEWVAYEMPKDMADAGILTQISFLALHSHPGKTSPTQRGKALRELFLCQKVPDPPANVSFSRFNAADADGTKPLTVRERLNAHAGEPVCAGCHRLVDPIGLSFENFDTIGGFHRTENNEPIDASGKFANVSFQDATGLGQALHDSPQISSCLVQRLYAYASARQPTQSETTWLKNSLDKGFAEDGYRIRQILRRITLDPDFYRVSGNNESVASNN